MKYGLIGFALGVLASFALACSVAIEGQIGAVDRPPVTNCPE